MLVLLQSTPIVKSAGLLRHYFIEIPRWSLVLHPGGYKKNRTAVAVAQADSKTHVVADLCPACLDKLLVRFYSLDVVETSARIKDWFPISNCEFLAHSLLGSRHQVLSFQYVAMASIFVTLVLVPFVPWLSLVTVVLVVILYTYNLFRRSVQYRCCEHQRALGDERCGRV